MAGPHPRAQRRRGETLIVVTLGEILRWIVHRTKLSYYRLIRGLMRADRAAGV
jgi:hypothetical protein